MQLVIVAIKAFRKSFIEVLMGEKTILQFNVVAEFENVVSCIQRINIGVFIFEFNSSESSVLQFLNINNDLFHTLAPNLRTIDHMR